jgi:hypothetical protein
MLLAILLPLVAADIFSPGQVRISWAEEDDSMYITWASENPSPYAGLEYTPVDSPDQEVLEFKHHTRGYWRSFQNVRNKESRILYVCWAKMVNLEAGKYYKYRVGDKVYGYTPSFVLQAKKDHKKDPLTRFIVYGDLGVGEQAYMTMDSLEIEMYNLEYDAILHVGDMAYEINDWSGYKGDMFLDMIEPLASKIPYMVAQGNHEGPDLGATDHYINRFTMPGQGLNFFYSFNVGKVHFLAYSTEFPIQKDYEWQKVQMDFIMRDLNSVNRTHTPWVVAYAHRPLYCSADWNIEYGYGPVPRERHNGDCLEQAPIIRKAFEDVFYENKVDLLLYGHVHAYERFSPVYNNQTIPSEFDDLNHHINPRAPVVIITGNPGQAESYAPVSSTPLPFSLFQSEVIGYGRLTVFNETSLLFEQVASEDQSIVDHVWIVKV